MGPGQIVLLVYAVFMLIGGWMGYRAGSKVSLIAGSASGVLLLAALVVTFSDMSLGLWIGLVVGLLLCVITGIRLAKTRKLMPAGMLFAVSLVATLILFAISAG